MVYDANEYPPKTQVPVCTPPWNVEVFQKVKTSLSAGKTSLSTSE